MADPVSGFVATLAEGQVVRAHMAPVFDGAHALDGFVLWSGSVSEKPKCGSFADAFQGVLIMGENGSDRPSRIVDADRIAIDVGANKPRLDQNRADPERAHFEVQSLRPTSERMLGSSVDCLERHRHKAGDRTDVHSRPVQQPAGASWEGL
jgi:hypothetical protein